LDNYEPIVVGESDKIEKSIENFIKFLKIGYAVAYQSSNYSGYKKVFKSIGCAASFIFSKS